MTQARAPIESTRYAVAVAEPGMASLVRLGAQLELFTPQGLAQLQCIALEADMSRAQALAQQACLSTQRAACVLDRNHRLRVVHAVYPARPGAEGL